MSPNVHNCCLFLFPTAICVDVALTEYTVVNTASHVFVLAGIAVTAFSYVTD